MIKTNNIHHIPTAKQVSATVKSAAGTVKSVLDVPEISETASKALYAVQKGLIGVKSKALNRSSGPAKFFGVDSPENIMEHLTNHLKLIDIECSKNEINPLFLKRTYISVDRPSTMKAARNRMWSGPDGGRFGELCERPARLTFNSKLFGKNGKESPHTIGILYHPKTKTLYCLDSLPNTNKKVKMYQDALAECVFKSPNGEIENIIFSSKPQQKLTEFTCNNWTLANIEGLQKALKEGKTIDSVEKLNAVLPDNINTILKKQYETVINSV